MLLLPIALVSIGTLLGGLAAASGSESEFQTVKITFLGSSGWSGSAQVSSFSRRATLLSWITRPVNYHTEFLQAGPVIRRAAEQKYYLAIEGFQRDIVDALVNQFASWTDRILCIQRLDMCIENFLLSILRSDGALTARGLSAIIFPSMVMVDQIQVVMKMEWCASEELLPKYRDRLVGSQGLELPVPSLERLFQAIKNQLRKGEWLFAFYSRSDSSERKTEGFDCLEAGPRPIIQPNPQPTLTFPLPEDLIFVILKWAIRMGVLPESLDMVCRYFHSLRIFPLVLQCRHEQPEMELIRPVIARSFPVESAELFLSLDGDKTELANDSQDLLNTILRGTIRPFRRLHDQERIDLVVRLLPDLPEASRRFARVIRWLFFTLDARRKVTNDWEMSRRRVAGYALLIRTYLSRAPINDCFSPAGIAIDWGDGRITGKIASILESDVLSSQPDDAVDGEELWDLLVKLLHAAEAS